MRFSLFCCIILLQFGTVVHINYCAALSSMLSQVGLKGKVETMKKIRTFAIFLSLLLVLPLVPVIPAAAAEEMPQNTVFVSPTLSGSDGTAYEVDFGGKKYNAEIGKTAFKSPATAIKALSAGGTMWLGAGTYSEALIIDRDITILGPKAGIDPNVRGKNRSDDWTRNPERGNGEATLTTSWHVGIYASSKTVYDCHKVTIDGIAISGAGMLRSNYGGAGYIELTYRNILVSGYTTNGNGPFYCYSYYPDKATNLYLRDLTLENIRFEGHTTATGFHLTVENMTASGIYFDGNSTGKCFGFVTVADSAASKESVNITVKDSMFRQKVNQVLNFNFTTNSGGHNFNKNISQRKSVNATVENCVFYNCDSGASTNNNIIVPQISTGNVYFNISNNLFVQTEKAADNFIAIHGAGSELPLGEKFTLKGNSFIGIPTALSIPQSTTAFDLSGSYFAPDGVAAKPVVNGPDKTEWWYLDAEMTKTSRDVEERLDGVPAAGKVDASAGTVTDSVDTESYTFAIRTEAYNTFRVYADRELTKSLGNTVRLSAKENTFYLEIRSMSGKLTKVYEAKITTSKPDVLSFDLASEVHFFGRTYAENGAYFFNWSASGFSVRFRGSGVSAVITSSAPGGSNNAYLKIYVDGVEMEDVELKSKTQTVNLAAGLDPSKEHTVRVLKRTNARSSTAAVTDIRLTDGEKLSPEKNSSRLIEFIGDSLTVGYAASKTAPGATAWSTATEDVTRTYVKQIADAFDADYNVVAISGRGIVRNTGGDTDKLMPFLYGYLDQYNNPGVAYDFARQPDVIVINLATNDASGNNSSLTAAEFKTGLRAFLKDVRAKNPNAEIVYAYGLTSTKYSAEIKSVVEEMRSAGDAHISYLQLKVCSASEKLLNHTTAEAYVSRGEAIIELISSLTGWKAGEPAETEAETEAETMAPETPAATETDAPASETAAASDTEKADKKGCGSSAAAAAVLAAVIPAAVISRRRRRED